MDAQQRQQWQIGELARRTGVSVRALRHCHDLGLLTPSARAAGGYLLHGEADVQRLYRIVAPSSRESVTNACRS